MLQYIIRRVLAIIPTLFGVSIVAFLLLNLIPGDPASALLPPDAGSAELEAMRERLGLDAPIHVRYWTWLSELLRGNWGYSYTTGRPVLEMIWSRLIPTIELVSLSFLISTILGIGFGIIGALKQHSMVDHVLTFLGLAWMSVPEFFFGLLGIYIFGIRLDLLPIGGRMPLTDVTFWSRLSYIIMPATVLGLPMIAALMRYTRASMIEVLDEPYITTAFSKGAPPLYVYVVHAFRNASIPVMVVLVFRIINLVGGAVVVENVFSWPGMGTLIVSSINNRDYPLVLAILLLTTFVVLLVSLLVDILTAVIDPRVRYE